MSSLGDVGDILRGVMATLFGFAGRLIARAVLLIFAGQTFGIVAIGHLGVVSAVTELTAAICVMGLNRSLHDMLSFDTEQGVQLFGRIVNALLLSVLLALFASIILGFIWWRDYPGQWGLIIIICLAVPATTIMDVTLTATKFKRVIRWDVWARCVVEPWVFLVAGIIFWTLGLKEFGLLYAYAGSVFFAMASAIIGLVQVFGIPGFLRAKIDISTWPFIIKKSFSIGITDVGIMALRRLDLVILGIFVGKEGAGLLYVAQQIVTVPHKIGGAFQPMLAPVIARLHNRRNNRQIGKQLSGVCRWIFTMQFALTIALIIYGDKVLSVIGPEFTTGALILAIILVAELIDGSFLSAETPLIYAHPKIPPIILIITLAIEVVVIAVMSYLWGVMGAAIGFFIAITFLNASRLFMLKRHMNLDVLSKDYLAPLWAGMALFIWLATVRFGVSSSYYVNWPTIIIGFGLYAWLIKRFALTKTDRVLIRHLRQRKLRALT